MSRKLKNELITLSWLLPKCEYAVEHCDDVKLLKMRFNQLCKVNDRILKCSFSADEYHRGYCDGSYDAYKHGHWNRENSDYDCSNCGNSLSNIMDADSYYAIGFDGVPYCPYCGAKMDEVTE